MMEYGSQILCPKNCLIVVQIYMDQHLHIKITTVAKYLKMSKKLQIVK